MRLNRGLLMIAGFISLFFAAQALAANPFGICAHLQRPYEYKAMNQILTEIHQAGIGWVRIDFSWSGIEPHKGQWNFKQYDKIVQAAKAHHIQLLPILDHSVSWAKPAYKHLDAWTSYVRHTVSHYKNDIHDWEVWNEENGGFWNEKPSAKNYVTLLKATYHTIKQVNPNIEVVSGGVAGLPWDYMKGMIDAGALKYCDAFAIHPYSMSQSPESRDLFGDLRKVRALIQQSQYPDKPIWITEIGWPTNAPGKGIIVKVMKAGLQKLLPGRSHYTVGLLALPGFPGSQLLTRAYTQIGHGRFHTKVIDAEALKHLNPQETQVLMLPIGESYPGSPFLGELVAYVHRGGILALNGGVPLYYRIEKSGHAQWKRAPSKPARRRLHIAFEAWWTGKDIPHQTSKLVVNPLFHNLISSIPHVSSGDRFLTGKHLTAGDTLTPIITGVKGKYHGIVAGVYDLKNPAGGIIASTFMISGCMTETQQAQFLARSFIIARRAGIQRTFWYEFWSPEGASRKFDKEAHFGIVHRNLSKKPAYNAYATLTHVMPPGSKIDRQKFRFDGIYKVHWTQPNGRNVYAIWAPIPQKCTVKIMGTVDQAYGYLGNHVSVHGGIEQLTANGGPIYLIGPSSLSIVD